jgi:glycyl-tRNA synthetase beta chain
LPLALTPLLNAAAAAVAERVPEALEAVPRVRAYILERLRGYLLDQGMAPEVFEAVAAADPDAPLDFVRRARAVQQFRERPEAEALAGANKRIQNLLRRAELDRHGEVDAQLLQAPAEQLLLEALRGIEPQVAAAVERGDYVAANGRSRRPAGAGRCLLRRRDGEVEDPALRANRLALLARLARRFDSVADISRLATG